MIGDRKQFIMLNSCVAGVYINNKYYDFSHYQLTEYRSWYKINTPVYIETEDKAGYLGILCINEGAKRRYLGKVSAVRYKNGISKTFARIADTEVKLTDVDDSKYISEKNFFVVTAKIGKATKVWRRVSRSSYINLFSGKELSEYMNNINPGINILEVNVFGVRKNAIKFMYED